MSAVLTPQSHRRRRHRQARAELLRLDAGPLGQLAARNAGREAEVVFDSGRCPGLATGGDRLDPQHVQSFRGGIERGREPGGPRTHDDDVAQGRRPARRAESNRASELGIARVAQDLTAARDHDRRLVWLNGKAAEQGLRLVVLLEVDPLMGQAVAGQELAQAPGLGRKPRADQLDPRADADQDRTPGHECAQNHIAEGLVLGDDLAQHIQRNLDHLAPVTDDAGEIEPLADQQAELAEEAVLALDRNDPVLLAVALNDRDRSRLDDEEVAAVVARGKQNLAGLDRAQATELAKSRPLIVVETGEGSVTVGRLRCFGPDSLVFAGHRNYSLAPEVESPVRVEPACSSAAGTI